MQVEVFADVWCPFTHVGLRRLVERRDHVAARARRAEGGGFQGMSAAKAQTKAKNENGEMLRMGELAVSSVPGDVLAMRDNELLVNGKAATLDQLIKQIDGHVTACALLTGRFEGHEIEEWDVADDL